MIKQKKQPAKSKTEHLKLYSQSRKRKKSEKKLWDTTGKSIHTLWEFQREDKEKKVESLFKEIMAEKFLSLGK